MKRKKSIGRIMSLVLAGMMTISGLPSLEVKAAQTQPDILASEGGGAGQEGNVYYVALNGSDENSGTLEKPFRTIQKATEVMVPGDTCYVREGIYDETVVPAGNGTAGSPITIRNYDGESVTVSGCQQITGWIADQKEGIYKAPMEWSLGDNGDENQVFVNGKLMYEARYPNVEEGSTLTNFNYAMTGAGTGFNGTTSVPRAEESKLVDPAFKEFATTADFFDGAKIWMVPGSEWTALTSYVKSYDPSTGTIIYPSTYRGRNNKGGYYNPLPNKPYYIFGAYGLLDAENEWWYSKDEKMLYVKIAGGKNPDTAGAYLEAKKRTTAFDLSSCSYINIDGINTRGATVITDSDSTHLSLRNMKCEYVSHKSSIGFESLDSNASPQDDLGVLIKGSFIEVNGCEISNSSGPLINFQGSDNSLINSYVHDGNYIGTYAGHSKLSGRRQFVSNNTMCESGRDVVSFRNLAESVVQYNDIYGAGSLTKDVGVMYTAETDGQNTLIHHNFIHDNHTVANSNGFYLDEMSNNFIVFNNSMWNAGNAMCVNHPSMYNLIYNNTGYDKTSVSDSYTATFRDDRGRQYINNYISGKTDNNPSATASFYKNNKAPGLADAKFADAEKHDFRIEEDSVLAGAGIPVSGVTGDNPSIGAYEPGENYKVGHDFENPPAIAASPDVSEFEFRNLIRNGGFEYGTLEGWNGSAQVILNTAWHSTTQIAATCFYGAVLQPGQSILQTISVEPGTAYNLTLLTRSKEGSSVTFGAMGVNGKDVMEQAASTGTSWGTGSRKTTKFQTGEKDSSVTIAITNSGEKELYLDDIGVQKDVAVVGDLSQKIRETYDAARYEMTLEFEELEEGHHYYYSASGEKDASMEKGMFVMPKPEGYDNELASGDAVTCYPKQYINIVETSGNKVIGVSSVHVVGSGANKTGADLADIFIRKSQPEINQNEVTLAGGESGKDYMWLHRYSTSETTYALMKFDISNLDLNALFEAKIRFYIDHGNSKNYSSTRKINVLAVERTDWKEEELTWKQAQEPAEGNILVDESNVIGQITLPRTTDKYLCEVDVTDYVREKAAELAKQKADGTENRILTLALSYGGNYNNGDIYIVTKENTAYAEEEYKPQIVFSEYSKVPTILSVDVLDGVSAYYGTPAGELVLPQTVKAALETGEIVDVQIAWDMSAYQPETIGEQVLAGTLVLPDGVLNIYNKATELKVTVKEKTFHNALPLQAVTGVRNGTPLAEAALPQTVIIVTDCGQEEAAVSWDLENAGYDPAIKDAQSFDVSGTIVLPAGVILPGEAVLSASGSDSDANAAGSLQVVINVTVDAAVRTDELQLLYDSNKDMEQGDYTQESWEVFQAVLGEAEAALALEEPTQEQIDLAQRNLQLGIAGLRTVEEVTPADTAALQELYNANKDRVNDGYTEETFAVLQQAVALAGEILAYEKPTQAQVDLTKEILQNALDGLEVVVIADKSALEELYNENKDITNDHYTFDSWNLFTRARANAEIVLNTENVTQAQVDAARDLLAGAAAGLVKEPVDPKEELRTLFNLCSNVSDTGYTAVSWKQFQDALKEAGAVLDNEDAGEEDIQGAYDELITAFRALEKPEVDRRELQALYREYKDMENTEFTDSSFADLQSALAEAKTVLDNEAATQAQVDAAAIKISDALKGLVKRADTNALLKKYEELVQTVNDGYTADSWNAFEAALAQAESALHKPEVTQAEADKALNDLANAYNSLTKDSGSKPDPDPGTDPNPGTDPDPGTDSGQGNSSGIDRGTLSNLYKEASAYTAANYTSESFAAFEAAFRYARTVLDKENVSQYEVDWAQMDLKAKMDGLQKAEGAKGTGSAENTNNAGTASNSGAATLGSSPATGDSVNFVLPLTAAGVGILIIIAYAVIRARRKGDME